jgi:hypothetical protein
MFQLFLAIPLLMPRVGSTRVGGLEAGAAKVQIHNLSSAPTEVPVWLASHGTS